MLGGRVRSETDSPALGPVAAACTARAAGAVVICRPDGAPVVEIGSDRHEIVVGVDGTEASLGALRQGARFAESMGLPLLAICAHDGGTSPVPNASTVLAAASRQVFGSTPPAWYRSSGRMGAPEEVLGRASARARMLLIGDGGPTVSTTAPGSVSALIASWARCPVVVFHATRSADPDSLVVDRLPAGSR